MGAADGSFNLRMEEDTIDSLSEKSPTDKLQSEKLPGDKTPDEKPRPGSVACPTPKDLTELCNEELLNHLANSPCANRNIPKQQSLEEYLRESQ